MVYPYTTREVEPRNPKPDCAGLAGHNPNRHREVGPRKVRGRTGWQFIDRHGCLPAAGYSAILPRRDRCGLSDTTARFAVHKGFEV